MKQKFNFPLINAHTHAAMVAFRGLAEDLPLDKWLKNYIWPNEKKLLNPKFIYDFTLKAITEMKINGIRLFADMYFWQDMVAKAAKKLNMPVVLGEAILDFPTSDALNFQESIKITENLLKEYKNDPLVKVAVCPHSIYTVSQENLIKAKRLSDKYQTPYHIHLSETKQEFDNCLKTNGLTPVAYLDKLGVLNNRSVLVHCVYLTDQDINIISKRKANVVHCPLSNLKLGSGIMPLSRLLKAKVNVCLGTDGAASSNRLDIWEAGKFSSLIHKGITCDPSIISTKDIVKMMTVNGLKALGYQQFNGVKTVDMEKQIASENDFNYLYSLNSSDINFSQK